MGDNFGDTAVCTETSAGFIFYMGSRRIKKWDNMYIVSTKDRMALVRPG